MKIIETKILSSEITLDHLKPKTDGSAGIDLYADISGGSIALSPGEVELIGTGIAIHIADPGYAGMILPRSGLGHKGLVLGNLVGLIDSDYQGELKVSAWNRSGKTITINHLDRIAQLVVVNVSQPRFDIVSEFAVSERGANGFGSTGVI